MDKQTFRVVQVTVQPGQEAKYKHLKSKLSQAKALSMRDKLESKLGDFDPNKVVSYLVEPAN